MAKKVTITLLVLYLLGVAGVSFGALSANWNADWPFHSQLSDALKAGFAWPIAVVELLASD